MRRGGSIGAYRWVLADAAAADALLEICRAAGPLALRVLSTCCSTGLPCSKPKDAPTGSARTVQYHLGKVFAKLAISSRAQLDRALPRDSATTRPR